jgi:hypothetical protein
VAIVGEERIGEERRGGEMIGQVSERDEVGMMKSLYEIHT